MNVMKKLICLSVGIFALWMYHLVAKAPEQRCLYIERAESIKPYESIWFAVAMEESKMNPKAYNSHDPNGGSHGIVQIGKERLKCYNRQTGSYYTIKDLYNVEVSKKIFMYYAVRIGWRNSDLIIRKWNGSGPKTYAYLKRVKRCLKH